MRKTNYEKSTPSKRMRGGRRNESMFDVRSVFGKNRVDDIAEFSGNGTDTGAVMFALGAFPLVESAEIGIEANGDIGSDE